MLALRFDAETISREKGKTAIAQQILTELQKKVTSLLNKVLDTALPKELKAILVEKLEDIRLAILIYRVSGTEGLQQALESSLGAIFLCREHMKEIKDDKQKRTLSEVFEFMAHLSEILGFTLQAAQLIAPFIPLLGPGGS